MTCPVGNQALRAPGILAPAEGPSPGCEVKPLAGAGDGLLDGWACWHWRGPDSPRLVYQGAQEVEDAK